MDSERWFDEQRDFYKKGELTAYHISELEKLDWWLWEIPVTEIFTASRFYENGDIKFLKLVHKNMRYSDKYEVGFKFDYDNRKSFIIIYHNGECVSKTEESGVHPPNEKCNLNGCDCKFGIIKTLI
jgi:hypothetical protein